MDRLGGSNLGNWQSKGAILPQLDVSEHAGAMDVPRKKAAWKRWLPRVLAVLVIAGGIGGVTYGLAQMETAAPVVDTNLLWIDDVHHGEFVRTVRGSGVLVPKVEWWIPAPAEGRVETIHLDPGEEVTPDSPIFELGNPAVEQAVWTARQELAAANAELTNREAQLDTDRLDREDALVILEAEHEVAKRTLERDTQLHSEGLLSQYLLDESAAKVDELETRVELAGRRLEKSADARKAQLEALVAKVEQAKGILAMREQELSDMRVTSARAGVLQQVLVEVGQQVTPSTSLAKVAQPDQLDAELQVAESQMRDVTVGQPVEIDTRNGLVDGRVARVDPTVLNGTVTVEVELLSELPRGMRSDLSVEGSIELDRADAVTYTGRPVGARENSNGQLFKLDGNGQYADRVAVRYGRSAINSMEILEGLSPGDRVILSDMTRWEHVDRIRLR